MTFGGSGACVRMRGSRNGGGGRPLPPLNTFAQVHRIVPSMPVNNR